MRATLPIVAVLMCDFVLGGVRLITERFATYRTGRQARSVHVVSQSLQPQALA
jgi:hypothetical protein